MLCTNKLGNVKRARHEPHRAITVQVRACALPRKRYLENVRVCVLSRNGESTRRGGPSRTRRATACSRVPAACSAISITKSSGNGSCASCSLAGMLLFAEARNSSLTATSGGPPCRLGPARCRSQLRDAKQYSLDRIHRTDTHTPSTFTVATDSVFTCLVCESSYRHAMVCKSLCPPLHHPHMQ